MAMLDGVPLLASLEDVMPLGRLLAPVGRHKRMIVQALEHIEASKTPDGDQSLIRAPSQAAITRSEEEASSKGQAFGTVLQAVLQYLVTPYHDSIDTTGMQHPLEGEKDEQESKKGMHSNARVLCFLSGTPTLGIGNLDQYVAMKYRIQENDNVDVQKDFESLKETVIEFYNQTALVAASLGIVLDLFLLPSRPMCLEVLSSLATHSGGGMWMYNSTTDENLIHDLRRHLSDPHAQGCLMRIRLPSQLKIAKAYGNLMKDPLYDDVYHILVCDAFETFSLDVEFDDDLPLSTTLQVVFQYSVPTFVEERHKTGFLFQRRLRIATLQKRVSQIAKELYSTMDVPTVLKFLMHKVMVAVEHEGTLKAAVLLQDWLIILAASYAKCVPDGTKPMTDEEDFDRLMRGVYGLLRSSLMLGRYHRSNEDRDIVVRHRWSSLPPSDLEPAVYPHFMAYSTSDAQAAEYLPLSRLNLEEAKGRLLVLDAGDVLTLFATAGFDGLFPPSSSSSIGRTIDRLRQERKTTPYYFTFGEDDLGSRIVYDRLLDDPIVLDRPLQGENGIVFEGYVSFVDWIKTAAEDYRLS